MKKLLLGLVKGRHPLPVEDYIFQEIKNVMDFSTLEEEAFKKLLPYVEKCDLVESESPSCYMDYPDVPFIKNDIELNIYVTGLTPATLAVINACRRLVVREINFYHYDREKNEYKKQTVTLW